MRSRTCIVTGANSGIGKVTARALARRGAHVVIVDIHDAEATAADIRTDVPSARIDTLVADLSSQQEVRALADTINHRYEHIHVLVNNAGRHLMRRETSVDGLEMNLALNCLSPFLLTHLLLDKLVASSPARIVNVASVAHRVPGRFNFDDLNTERETMYYAYGKSKIANILWVKAMARRLRGTGVTINAVCPGLVATNIFDNYLPPWFSQVAPGLARLGLMASAEEGARMQIALASDAEFEGVSGCYYSSHPLARRLPPQPRTLDESLQERVWEVAIGLTGVSAGARLRPAAP